MSGLLDGQPAQSTQPADLAEVTEPAGERVAGPAVEGRPTIVLCPEGPMLLRGDVVIEDAEGNRHRTTRPVSAVCRCNKSATKPWCDGTHKLLPKKLRP